MCHQVSLIEKVLLVRKVSKPNRGLTSFTYSALFAIGDMNGGIGLGKGRGNEQGVAILNALVDAKKNFFKVPLNNGTIYHEIKGKHGSSMIILIPSKYRYGIFAGSVSRSIFEVMGISGIISKMHGSNNPYNISIATINALSILCTPFYISLKRNISLKRVFF